MALVAGKSYKQMALVASNSFPVPVCNTKHTPSPQPRATRINYDWTRIHLNTEYDDKVITEAGVTADFEH
jgi:hypothetical protein